MLEVTSFYPSLSWKLPCTTFLRVVVSLLFRHEGALVFGSAAQCLKFHDLCNAKELAFAIL